MPQKSKYQKCQSAVTDVISDFKRDFVPRFTSCRSTDVDIPQVVIGRPSWATSSSHDYCSMSVTEESVERVHTLPLKAMLDWKYDGDQTQRLHVTLNVTQDGDVRVEEEIIGDVPVSYSRFLLCFPRSLRGFAKLKKFKKN